MSNLTQFGDFTPETEAAVEGIMHHGEAYKVEPHLFYQGKEVGRMFMDGMQVGAAGCDTKIENNPTHFVTDAMPQKAKWARVECSFPIVKQHDKTNDGQGQPNTNEMFKMGANPGGMSTVHGSCMCDVADGGVTTALAPALLALASLAATARRRRRA